ncbi:MAG: hypothetical protein JST12_07100 [Armatimonadetes bacterium]|nr:hypothetical protein [Armatimonadota bacterium]
MIHDRANQVEATITKDGFIIARQTVSRPQQGQTSTLSIPNVPIDTPLSIRVWAEDTTLKDANANLIALSEATSTVTLHSGLNSLSFALISDTTDLDISGVPPSAMQISDHAQLSAVAKNANGDIVLNTPGQFTWIVTDPTIVSVDSSGMLVALANGTTSVQVTEKGNETQNAFSKSVSVAVGSGGGTASYQIVDLGTGKEPEKINNSSVVLAFSLNSNDTYTWSNGSWTLAQSNFKGTGMNDSGTIVGIVPPQRAAVVSAGNLSFLPLGGNNGVYPTGINASGDISAIINYGSGSDQAAVYRGGSLIPLPGIEGALTGAAYGINDSGLVVGEGAWNGPFKAYRHGVTWDITNAILDLATGMQTDAPVFAINNAGTACGFMLVQTTSGLLPRATMISGNQLSHISIPGIEPNGQSNAENINNLGQIIGEATTSDGHFFPYLWSPSGITDLQASIDPSLGWTISQVLSINDKGEIVGTGTLNGSTHVLLLKPAH